jgi:sugar lactone lactonase YvrE
MLSWSAQAYAAQGDIITIAGTNLANTSTAEGKLANITQIGSPEGIALDVQGNIYFADFTNHQIKRIDRKTGVLSVVAGTGVAGYSGDGGQATQAQLNGPVSLVFSPAGELYFSDYNNSVIRKINLQTQLILTVAGNGSRGFSGDGGSALQAWFNYPYGLAFDSYANLFVADSRNNRVRKIDSAGIVTTVAGTLLGFSGDGYSAINAKLYYPAGVALDNRNNLYISDTYNQRIRKVNNAGIITTVVGTGVRGYSGDGGQATQAQLYNPAGLVVDNSGNILFADANNNRIRKVDTNGVITTIAGSGIRSFSGDGAKATLASLNYPVSLAIDAYSNVYITDYSNNRIRMFGNILDANQPLDVSLPLVDIYSAFSIFQSLHFNNAQGGIETSLNYGSLPTPNSSTNAVFTAYSTFNIPTFASDTVTGGIGAQVAKITYNPIRLVKQSIFASPPDLVEVLFRAYEVNSNNPVSVLQPNNFIVQEDYKPVSVESTVSIQKVTELKHIVQTVVMFDISSSVNNANLQLMKQAAKNGLIDGVTGKLRVKDQKIAIYTFDDTVRLIQDYTSAPAQVIAAIDSITSAGVASTNFYGAIIDGMKKLNPSVTSTSLTETNLIMVTDGRDTASLSSYYDALNSARLNPLYIIGVQSPDLYMPDINAFIGTNTLNSRYFPVVDFSAIESALIEVGQYTDSLANSFYKLSYHSPARAGSHTIQVSVVESNSFYIYPLSGTFDTADFIPTVPANSPSNEASLGTPPKTGCLTGYSNSLIGWIVFVLMGSLLTICKREE